MKLFAVSIVAVVALASVSEAHSQTTSIFVPNFSFETPVNNYQTYSIPGFTFVNADGFQGTQSISPSAFTTGSIDGTGVAFLNITQPSASTITSGTLSLINPGDSYTATVEVGNQVGTGFFNDPGNVFLNILANGTVVATTSLPIGTVPEGTIQDYSVTLTGAQSAALGGQGLSFQMEALDPTALGFDSNPDPLTNFTPIFDNVRVTDTAAIPEPSTYAMMFAGLALLGFVVRRKRVQSDA